MRTWDTPSMTMRIRRPKIPEMGIPPKRYTVKQASLE